MISEILILREYLRSKNILSKLKSRETLASWQNEKARWNIGRALKLSAFYRTYYEGLDISNWESFPTINKIIFMDNFDTLNTVGISKDHAFSVARNAELSRDFKPTIGNITVGLSSGTSGNRGLWMSSPSERHWWAGNIIARQIPSGIFSKQRIAFFLRANSNLYGTIGSSRLQFKYFDMLEPVEKLILKLNSYQPTILSAPPSMLVLLAENIKSGSLRINPIKVISVADVLDRHDRKFVSEQFNLIIHEVYMATEGFIGSTCTLGTMHLNEDMMVIQKNWIDKSTLRFTPIITDLNRITQPVIRYELDDILIERQTPCPCGSILTSIEQIEGRSDDILYFRSEDGSRMIPVFPDFFRNAIISYSDRIREYAVIQNSPETVDVYLDCDDSEIDFSGILTKVFTRFGVKIPEVRISRSVPKVNEDKKRRRIRREFPSPQADVG